MDQVYNKYDKFIWRMNGIFLFLLGIVALGLIAFGAYKLLVQSNQKQSPDFINVNEKTKEAEHLRLGYLQKLQDTDLILIPLSSEDNSEGRSIGNFKSSGYYYKSNLRNYLLVNTKTKKSTWIWETNNNRILSDKVLCDSECPNNNKISRGISFEIVEKDTNSDGNLDNKDQRTLQFFDVHNFSKTTIVSNIDREIGVELVGKDEVIFLYSEKGKSFYKTFDISKKVVSDAVEIGLAPK